MLITETSYSQAYRNIRRIEVDKTKAEFIVAWLVIHLQPLILVSWIIFLVNRLEACTCYSLLLIMSNFGCSWIGNFRLCCLFICFKSYVYK